MPDNFTYQEQVNFLNIFLEDNDKIRTENDTEIFPLLHKSAYINLFKKEEKSVRLNEKAELREIYFDENENFDENEILDFEIDMENDPKPKKLEKTNNNDELNELIKKNRNYFQSEKGREEFYDLFKDLEGMNLNEYKDLALKYKDKNNKQSSASTNINQKSSAGSNNNKQSSSTSNINQKDSAGSDIIDTEALNPDNSASSGHKNKKFLYSILSACIVNIFIFVYSKEILNKIGNLTQNNSFIDFTKNNQILSIFCLCATVILAEIIIGISCKKGFELIGSQEANKMGGNQSI